MLDVRRGGSADQCTHGERGAEHRGRLAEKDEFEPLRISACGDATHIFGLPANEECGARSVRELCHQAPGEFGAIGVALRQQCES